MNILGIDPGIDGALLLIDMYGNVLKRTVTPFKISRVKNNPRYDRVRLVAAINPSRAKMKTVKSVDHAKLTKFLQECQTQGSFKTYIERVGARAGDGVVGAFNFGYSHGCVCQAASFFSEITLVTPQRWTNFMHKGISKAVDPKRRSRDVIRLLFPHQVEQMKRHKGDKAFHSGLVDARLIAEYGRLMSLDDEVTVTFI